jgi:hypothetical protein
MEDDKMKTTINMNDDDQLLASFFTDNTINVPEDDFTERVMQHLPERSNRLARIWTWLCAIVGVVFLIATKSWLTIYMLLKNMLLGINLEQLSHINLAPYILAMLIISALMGYSLAKEKG